MVNCSLRWSRIEFVFISTCHLAAVVSVLQAALWGLLELTMVAGVLGSFLLYLRDRLQTFYRLGQGSLVPALPVLWFGQEFARVDYRGRELETELPSVIHLSEFLVVLSLRCSTPVASFDTIHLVLWPDSLLPREERRLRRYLRFELPKNLYDG